MITEEEVRTTIKVLKGYAAGDPQGISAALLEELELAIEEAMLPVEIELDPDDPPVVRSA